MSQKKYLYTINREIQQLNNIIDRKILVGAAYRSEARRHKELLAQIRRVQRRRIRTGFFGMFSRSA